MAVILANPVEICFGSFTATSPVPMTTSFPVATGQVDVVPVTTTISDPMIETHPPKPYDLIQGM
jgi:hypothetical protein